MSLHAPMPTMHCDEWQSENEPHRELVGGLGSGGGAGVFPKALATSTFHTTQHPVRSLWCWESTDNVCHEPRAKIRLL